jgi:hypothetical protein
MKNKALIPLLFAVAALYDGLLGAAFLIYPRQLFEYFQVTPPNHYGYVQFPAAILIIFALMFLAVAVRPIANRNLIPYGILLKVSYCAVVFAYWFTAGLPNIWKPFAICDALFAIAFAAAALALSHPTPST